MSNKQFLAQMGVFALLALNAGVYYMFWPKNSGGPVQDVKAAAPKTNRPAEAEEQESAVFANVRAEALAPVSSAPLLPEIPTLYLLPNQDPAPQERKGLIQQATLFDAIELPKPGFPIDLTTAPILPDPLLKQLAALVPLQPLVPAHEGSKIEGDDIVTQQLKQQLQFQQEKGMLPVVELPLPSLPEETKITAKTATIAMPDLTGNMQQSPWLLKVEVVGARTKLLARLEANASVVFHIHCDRVEMKAPDGALQAIGKVTFRGAGLDGSCERLKLPLGERRILFEENVVITQPLEQTGAERAGSLLRGEKILWEAPPSFGTPEKSSEVRPASFDFPQPTPALPAILGGPK